MKTLAKHTIIKDKPFVRAHLDVYGVSKQDAESRLKSLMAGIQQDLPKDCTVWEPEYKGFSAEEEQHYWSVVVTLGDDKDGAERVIAQRVGSCK